MSASTTVEPKPAAFQPTRWSLVLAARQRQTPEGAAALEWLCERYWQPLHTWAKAKGLQGADAEDLVQGFFAHAVQSGLVASAEAGRGRFRTYLLSCLEHYWTDRRRRASAVKRGGAAEHVSLAEENEEPAASTLSPAQDYDRAWAVAVLDRAMDRLARECDADDHAGRFAVLRVFLDGDRGEMPLADAGKALGLSLPAVKSAVHRLRQRLGQLVRDEVRDTVPAEADVESELRELFQALRDGIRS